MSNEYRNYATTVNDDVKVTPLIDPTPTPEPTPDPEPKDEPVIGVVSGAKKLNVRSEPSLEGSIVCVLPEGSKVMIDKENSTEDWISVYTEAGLDGYCMSDYIKIEE